MNVLVATFRPIVRDVVFGVVNSRVFPRALRSRAWGALGLKVDPSALINPGAFIGAWRGLEVGANTFINYGCFFDLGATTKIGDRCDIGYNVMFVTSSHRVGPSSRRAGQASSAPIRVGEGVWIGARAVLLPGTTVGDGCVIAAGSVVVRDCDPNGLYAGAPAVRVRELGS